MAITELTLPNVIIGSGSYMSLFEKRDGKYYSVRDMSASDGSVK